MQATKVNVTVPADLLGQAKDAGINVSELTARAIAAELNRRARRAALRAYLETMRSEAGAGAEEVMAAEIWAERVAHARPGARR
jgi:post-segregation antitoxin (ccd killing protein)